MQNQGNNNRVENSPNPRFCFKGIHKSNTKMLIKNVVKPRLNPEIFENP